MSNFFFSALDLLVSTGFNTLRGFGDGEIGGLIIRAPLA